MDYSVARKIYTVTHYMIPNRVAEYGISNSACCQQMMKTFCYKRW